MCVVHSAQLACCARSDLKTKQNPRITFSDGCLGFRDDEERGETRYVVRNAKLLIIKSLNASCKTPSGVSPVQCPKHPSNSFCLVDVSSPHEIKCESGRKLEDLVSLELGVSV